MMRDRGIITLRNIMIFLNKVFNIWAYFDVESTKKY